MQILSTAKLRSEIREQLKEEYPEVTFQFEQSMKEAEPFLSEAEILLTYGEDLSSDHIEKATRLKWIMVLSAGLERMPLRKIKERGILITNARGIHSIPMAEYTISVMLQVAREAKQVIANESEKVWKKNVPMKEITGSTIGVVGTGAIGCEIGRLAHAFRMKTLGVNRTGHDADHFDEIYKNEDILSMLPKCDYVVGVLPSTTDTRHYFRKSHFEKMKKSAVFINIGRGDTVNERELLDSLNAGEVKHAVLDVFENEPLDPSHPFWEMDTVTVTPHHSAISDNYQPRAIEIFKYNLRKYLKESNDMKNVIDPDRGY
ncbi:D-2-hydroxyacid dehydrogenase [Pseudalkalibacillus hwajinpoensis]|uniref:D-2-hydroxyacid dehydrogenase n=1 Tax=Guptibacillus hwajinpoensis TaxID=208199 RepID=A0A4U1MDG0_9BACL|nr:D-2-hydroxyacid dehydrogenase [Pseudalkalibacillus hwajinpoensis]TKD68362.1 D-2-hydroxyacid dehydrogenase [Pseudalkalibacillus hwajinpoensis]